MQGACRENETSVMCAQELKPLVYPVVQLLLGVAGLVPSPRYFPLRLRCIASLSALSAATGVFIPLAPPLLEVLTWSELRKAPAGQQAGKIPDLMTQLRAGQSQLRMPSYQEAVVNLVSPCTAYPPCPRHPGQGRPRKSDQLHVNIWGLCGCLDHIRQEAGQGKIAMKVCVGLLLPGKDHHAQDLTCSYMHILNPAIWGAGFPVQLAA